MSTYIQDPRHLIPTFLQISKLLSFSVLIFICYCCCELQNGGGEQLQLVSPRTEHGEGGGVHEAAAQREGPPGGGEPGRAVQRPPAEAAAAEAGFIQQILQQPGARTPGTADTSRHNPSPSLS